MRAWPNVTLFPEPTTIVAFERMTCEPEGLVTMLIVWMYSMLCLLLFTAHRKKSLTQKQQRSIKTDH